MLFLENEAQTKAIMEQCFSCQNKSVCEKLAKQTIYALFAQRPSIVFLCIFEHVAKHRHSWPGYHKNVPGNAYSVNFFLSNCKVVVIHLSC